MVDFKRWVVIILMGMVLAGCNSQNPVDRPKFQSRQVLVTIGPDTDFADHMGKRIHGLALVYEVGNFLHSGESNFRECTVYLRKYPLYLAHEVRHCFEGPWHGIEDNADDWK